MLTKKQVSEIKEHLSRAQNPLFFYDDDPDGLCAFLLLRRYLDRGKGVAIKDYPDMGKSYFRKVKELNADYIFIVDKPCVSNEFFEEARKVNIPVVWIDHHEEEEKKDIPDFINYYNPSYNKNPSNEPTTALCHQITQRKKDLWLAVVGCISDKFYPDFYSDFKEQYPELCIDSKYPFEILYKSDIGKISRMLSAGLKNRTTDVVRMIKYLFKAKGPYDVLKENNKNKMIQSRFNDINKKYQKFLKEARLGKDNFRNMVFFKYGGDTSMSSGIANELSFDFPEKYVFVVYVKGTRTNISGRGKDVKKVFLKAIKDLPESGGGGHMDAIGGQIRTKDIETFKGNLADLLE